MPPRIHPRKLIVEGATDKRVIPYLMEANGVAWESDGRPVVYIEPNNGIEALLKDGVIESWTPRNRSRVRSSTGSGVCFGCDSPGSGVGACRRRSMQALSIFVIHCGLHLHRYSQEARGLGFAIQNFLHQLLEIAERTAGCRSVTAQGTVCR